MAEVSAEPSMEEILSSIKRIIAEEEGAPASRRRTTVRPAAPPLPGPIPDAPDDEVLELSHPVPPDDPVLPEPPVQQPPALPTASSVTGAPTSAPILSSRTADATRGSLESLSRLIVKPSAPSGDDTLEGLVRELLKPMLREWLDAKLPELVEAMVAREIARISGRDH